MRDDVQYRFLGIYDNPPYEGVFREDTVQTKRSSITASLSSEECEFGSRPKKAAADSTSAAAIVIRPPQSTVRNKANLFVKPSAEWNLSELCRSEKRRTKMHRNPAPREGKANSI